MRDLYQRKKGGVYWCEFYDASGRRARRSTQCKDRRAAALVRQRFEREAHDPNRPAADAAPCTVAKVLDHFVNDGTDPDLSDATLSMYVQKSGHLTRLVGELEVAELQDIAVMQAYIRKRTEEGAARGTVHKELVTMRQALYAALEVKLIRFDPRVCFPRFRVKYVPKERWLSPEDVMKLLAQLEPHRQMWFVVALYTGARDSEIDRLEWTDISWRDGTIRIPGTKTDDAERTIPLLPVLAAVLRRSRRDAGPIVGEWLNVRRDLDRACSRVQPAIEPVTPNDLRRTFATWLINQGVAPNVVASLMGHGSTKMVEKVYGRVKRALMRREIAKLAGACTTGVPDSGPGESPESLVSPEALAKLAEILANPVLGPGIEPGTRGFSIRTHVNKYKDLKKKRRACTTGEPRRRVG